MLNEGGVLPKNLHAWGYQLQTIVETLSFPYLFTS
jgi:hypothetical protein